LEPETIIDVCIRAESLKTLQRSGWITAGVQERNYESVAAHSWGTCLLSLLVAKQLLAEGYQFDLGSVMELATVHDLPEIITTDIPHSAIEIAGQELYRAKENAEKAAIVSLFASLEEVGGKIIKAWENASKLESIEARIVAGADIIDMLIHAICLERNGISPKILDSFFSKNSKKLEKVDLPIIRNLYNILQKEHYHNLGNR
jgi:putative hydrolase of HD superfamily